MRCCRTHFLLLQELCVRRLELPHTVGDTTRVQLRARLFVGFSWAHPAPSLQLLTQCCWVAQQLVCSSRGACSFVFPDFALALRLPLRICGVEPLPHGAARRPRESEFSGQRGSAKRASWKRMPEQPAERINPYFVVDTGFVAPSRGNVCYEFQRSGRCIKGAACRFTHGDDISNAGVTPGVGQAGAVAPRADAKPWLSNAVSVVRCVLPRTFDARLFLQVLTRLVLTQRRGRVDSAGGSACIHS